MNKLIHACAGSGKTQHIIDHCVNDEPDLRRIIITYTVSAQEDIKNRLQKASQLNMISFEIFGWYSFLIKHIIRPYLPLVFPEIRITGFIFDSSAEIAEKLRYKKKENPERYFTKNGMLYRENIEDLALMVMERAACYVEKRLCRIYDEIIIDEVQDISGSTGLKIIEYILREEEIKCLLVGDIRQSLIDTNRAKKKSSEEFIETYRNFESEGIIQIEEKVETYRFNKSIANFSDNIFSDSLNFSKTRSLMSKETEHDGIFLVAEEDILDYISLFKPKVLRHSKKSWPSYSFLDVENFGVSKGREFDRVMILSTKAIQDFCLENEQLTGKNANAFYVAVTRARYSVAIAVKLSREKLLGQTFRKNCCMWAPEGQGRLF